MSIDNVSNTATDGITSSPSRRTVLKAGAWSVPVIAAAVATPLAAASTAVDLRLLGRGGDVYSASSPDQSRAFEIAFTTLMQASTLGTTPIPAGSTFTTSYDNRLVSSPSLKVDEATVSSPSSTVSGNVTTDVFVIPAEIPATEDGVALVLRFGTWNQDVWHTDIQPYTTLILPPSGTDSDTSNNGWTSEARYMDTIDAVVTATWRDTTIVDGNGVDNVCSIADTMTITAATPGDIPAGGSISLSGPSVSSNLESPYEYVEPITAVTVTSALLNGVDVSGPIGTPSGSTSFDVPVNTPIPAGQSLILDLNVEVIESATGWVWQGGHVQFMGGYDRNDLDNNVQAPA